MGLGFVALSRYRVVQLPRQSAVLLGFTERTQEQTRANFNLIFEMLGTSRDVGQPSLKHAKHNNYVL